MTKTIELALQTAQDVFRACAKPVGFHASGLPGGYEGVWARDSMSTSLGACLTGEKFRKTFAQSLDTLAKNQGSIGIIPNCVGSYNLDRQSDVTFNSIDAPLWYIIGCHIYANQYQDKTILKKHKKQIDKAYAFLAAQDPDFVGLIAQQPTNDWFDAFPHKYGYTIHCNALYYAALKYLGKEKEATNVKKIINGEYRAYSSLYDDKLGFYRPWGWKNHDTIRETENWFDTAGNLLAIITGLATPKIALSILNHIEKEQINRPYPCKCIWPPIKKGDPEWKDYFELCDAREPLSYSNAGIWPFIGGLYVAALVKAKQYAKAEAELERLAEGVMKKIENPGHPQYMLEVSKAKNIPVKELKNLRQKEFNEWLHGATGEPKGEPYQGWSAGLFVYGAECVKKKKVLFF